MTLEELLEKRREINAQIRELKSRGITQYGRVKIDKEHFPTAKPDEWGIYILRNMTDTGPKERWDSVIKSTDREEAIRAIPGLVADLQGLLRELKGGTV